MQIQSVGPLITTAGESLTINTQWTVTSPLGLITSSSIVAGDTTITVPSTSATAVIIVPGSTAPTTAKLKGIAGDTGVALSVTNPAVISLATVSSFVITTTGSTSTYTFIWL